jgi:glutamate transport system permease protein
MSADTVLYDVPGPRARRRAMVGTVVATVLILGLIGLVLKRLTDQGQFSMELWGPLIDPGNDSFEAVWRLILKGLVATLVAAGLAIGLSLVIGTVLGSIRVLLSPAARLPLIGFIELFRGLPVVITIYYVWQVLPDVGVDVGPLPGDDGLWYVVIGLTLYNSVIIAEIIRSGVNALPRGQGEAALAIGMTPGQSMRTVQLPQAFRIMLPALISQLVVVLKDTSLAAVLGLYIELLRRGNIIALNLDNPIQTLFVVGLIFILLNYALSRLAVLVEGRLARRVVPREQMEQAIGAGIGSTST